MIKEYTSYGNSDFSFIIDEVMNEDCGLLMIQANDHIRDRWFTIQEYKEYLERKMEAIDEIVELYKVKG